MSRTVRQSYPGHGYRPPWDKPGRGKFYKSQYHRAIRRVAKGTGKTKAIAYWASACNWKGT